MMTGNALLAQAMMRVIYVVMIAASLWIMLRGHNTTGGGFIGGMIAVAASAAYALVFDAERAQRRMRFIGSMRNVNFTPQHVAALGVVLALASGLPALVWSLPYLTHVQATLPLGWIELPLSTAMLFDLGVYLSVWGALGGYCIALLRAMEGAR